MIAWSLAFDVVIALLLVATISYAVILNRKLSALRASKDELAALLRSFSEATAKAEAGLEGIRRTAAGAGQELQSQVAKASALSEDLRFLIGRAGLSADTVEANIAKDRGGAVAKTGPSAARERSNSGGLKAANLTGRAQDAPRASLKSPAANGPSSQGLGATRPPVRAAESEPQVSAEQVALIKALDGVR